MQIDLILGKTIRIYITIIQELRTMKGMAFEILTKNFHFLHFIYVQVIDYLIVEHRVSRFKTLNCLHEKLQIFAVFKF